MTYYLAGPMTGYANFNFDAFHGAAKILRQQGYKVINPAENFGGRQDLPYEQYLATAHDQVIDEAEEGVILLAGWEASNGARQEVNWALEHGRAIYAFRHITGGIDSPQNEPDASCVAPGRDRIAIHLPHDVTERIEAVEQADSSFFVPIGQARALESLGNPLFLALLDYTADIHRRKAAGYSGLGQPDTWKNFREAENWGLEPWQGCTMRVGDKYRRAQNLLRDAKSDQVGEPLFDTLTDLANYVLILVCLLHEEGKVELPEHPALRSFA